MSIATTASARAKVLLRKYFEMSCNGLDPEDEAEIDEIVDALLFAAAHGPTSGAPAGSPSTNGAGKADVPPGVRFSDWLLKRPGSHSEAEHIGRSLGITTPVREWTEEQCRVVAAIFKRPRTDEQVDREARGRVLPPPETYAPGDEADPPAPPAECPIQDGKGLFRFLKDMEQDHGINIVKWVDTWAKGRGFDWKMTDWSASQVAEAYAAASRKLAEVAGPKPLFDAPDRPPTVPEASSSGPPASQAEVAKVREQLAAAVRKIAGAIHGEVTGRTIAAALKSLAEDHPQRKAIYSVTGCTDLPLLSSTLAVARERVRDIDSFAGPSLLREPTAAELLFDETEAPRE